MVFELLIIIALATQNDINPLPTHPYIYNYDYILYKYFPTNNFFYQSYEDIVTKRIAH